MKSSPEQIKRAPHAAGAVIRFWFVEAGPRKWFRGGPSFDADIARRFSAHHAAAATGLLEHWRASADGALALLLILDQFSRNLFRGDARAFACDPYARLVAAEALRRRFDLVGAVAQRPFFYLPFMHSERLEDQELSVRLFKATMPGSTNYPHAVEHRDIIARFGRFPHRNGVLERAARPEEAAFLRQGGFRG